MLEIRLKIGSRLKTSPVIPKALGFLLWAHWSVRVKGRTERIGAWWLGFFLCHTHHCPFPREKPERQLNRDNRTLTFLLSFIFLHVSFPFTYLPIQHTVTFYCLPLCLVPISPLLSRQKNNPLPVHLISSHSMVAVIILMSFLLSGPLIHSGISVREAPWAWATIQTRKKLSTDCECSQLCRVPLGYFKANKMAACWQWTSFKENHSLYLSQVKALGACDKHKKAVIEIYYSEYVVK